MPPVAPGHVEITRLEEGKLGIEATDLSRTGEVDFNRAMQQYRENIARV
jgi:hypothetical protein